MASHRSFSGDQESSIITDNISFTAHSRVDASDHPQLPAPSFDDDPPPASFQPPGKALTEASGHFVNDTRTHRTTDQSDDEDSEGALEGDAIEASDYVDHETDDFWNGEDVAVEDNVDPCEGIVLDWELLTEEFIVEAEELSKFGGFFIAYLVTHLLFYSQASFLSRAMIWISCVRLG